MAEIAREQFLNHLHDALTHLYNADQLRKSPLADLFGIGSRFDASAALKKTLTEAIDSMKPPVTEPDSSKSWRLYESLYCCFIQQLNQQVVADQLSISPRQLRREQHNALEYLADVLWQKYHLDDHPAVPQPENRASLIGEVDWLMEAQPLQPNRLQQEVQAALALIQPLAQKRGTTMQGKIPEELPGLAVPSAALNQVLVTLLDLAVNTAPGGTVCVSARKLPTAVEISISAQTSQGSLAMPNSAEANTNIQIAAELVRMSGGRVFRSDSDSPLPVRVVLPALEQFPVLVVDDNEDALQLFKRYSGGTRYNLHYLRDTELLMERIESLRPRIIVLDIMMPKENGWIVLGRLRQHRLTAETPIIICTVLPQEKLALSLGASAYLKKPVSRQAFLESLDQQFALLDPEFS